MDKTKQMITEMIDSKLNELSGRDIVAVNDMTDFLLDIRLYLMFNVQPSDIVQSTADIVQ